MRQATKASWDRITDIITGSDGGVAYAMLCNFLEVIDKQAEEGDEASAKLLDYVVKFDRFLVAVVGMSFMRGDADV